MKHTRFAKVLVAMFAGVLMVAALGGCAQQDTAAAQQQSENRQYMTQVNQTMDDLKSRLESFTDAVSRGDVVGMRTQADNAFKAIDDLNNLNVPDALKDIQKEYVDGTADLKDALNSYIDLYTEIDSAPRNSPSTIPRTISASRISSRSTTRASASSSRATTRPASCRNNLD